MPRRRRGEPVETMEYASMLRRMIRAHGQRVAAGDPEDLADLVALHAYMGEVIQQSVTDMRARNGWSWAQLGDALGVTRQAAQMRWGKR